MRNASCAEIRSPVSSISTSRRPREASFVPVKAGKIEPRSSEMV
jgi:hypothetical protein